jgi:peptidoglycan/xylan/chitin deacetylase (PgdA/CDA1 family)
VPHKRSWSSGDSVSALTDLFVRIKRGYQRIASRKLARREVIMLNDRPLISFTFDDFPRSALFGGGALLQQFGVVGTYYASLGLMEKVAPTGEIFRRSDLAVLLKQGHELGCHTFAHCHAYDTSADEFERSILDNRHALYRVAPEARFETMSYPISCARPDTKRRCAKYFSACRAGGQTFNEGTIDLNHLSAFFLEQSRDNPEAITCIIDETCRARGWLILATHDVCDDPTAYGCTPDLFESTVRYAVKSSAFVVPVREALKQLGVGSVSSRYSTNDQTTI